MRFPLLLVAAIAAGLAPAAAGAETFRSDYSVSLYGLTLARTHFESTITNDGFDVRGRLSSAGIAAIFDDTEGTTATSGSFSGSTPRPSRFRTDYTANGKRKMTEVTFSGGDVIKAVNKPAVNTRRKSWVPVRPADLKDVADPLSATLVRTGNPKDVCRRTLQVFDGAMRADLKLSYAATRRFSLAGTSVDAVVCDARFVPISGYRKNYKSIQYLRKSSGISIAFAEVGRTGVYAPVEARIGTQIGTITVRANRFEAVD